MTAVCLEKESKCPADKCPHLDDKDQTQIEKNLFLVT